MSAAVYRGCVVSGGHAAMLWTVEGGVYAVWVELFKVLQNSRNTIDDDDDDGDDDD